MTIEEAATTAEWAAMVQLWLEQGRPPAVPFADWLRETVDDAAADALTEAAALEFEGVSNDGGGGLRPYFFHRDKLWSWEESASLFSRSSVAPEVFAQMRYRKTYIAEYDTASDAVLDYLRAAAAVRREATVEATT